jgi:multiple sugar transport system permease protein
MSLGISFSSWGLTGPAGHRRPGRTIRELWRDPVLWQVFGNTAFYIVTIVPMQLALGLAMAVALESADCGGVSLFRMIYFLPVVTTIVAGAIVFRLLLSTQWSPGRSMA